MEAGQLCICYHLCPWTYLTAMPNILTCPEVEVASSLSSNSIRNDHLRQQAPLPVELVNPKARLQLVTKNAPQIGNFRFIDFHDLIHHCMLTGTFSLVCPTAMCWKRATSSLPLQKPLNWVAAVPSSATATDGGERSVRTSHLVGADARISRITINSHLRIGKDFPQKINFSPLRSLLRQNNFYILETLSIPHFTPSMYSDNRCSSHFWMFLSYLFEFLWMCSYMNRCRSFIILRMCKSRQAFHLWQWTSLS